VTHTIIRARRRTRFVIVDQRAVEDTRLSWAARGLLGYLLSRPDDWKVLVKDLRRRGDLGRDGIYKLLRELRDAGYLHYKARRDAHGRLRGGTYIVCEEPGSPLPDLPEALPKTEYDQIPTTTTTTRPTTTKDNADECSPRARMIFPPWIPDSHHAAAERIVASLDPPLAQMVVDEWVGSLAAGAVRRSPLGYLRALVENLERGDFTSRHAEVVAAGRCRPT
jgi:hypothetical protein